MISTPATINERPNPVMYPHLRRHMRRSQGDTAPTPISPIIDTITCASGLAMAFLEFIVPKRLQ